MLQDTSASVLATLQHHSLHQTFAESGMLSLPTHLTLDNEGMQVTFFSWQPTDFSYSFKESTLHDPPITWLPVSKQHHHILFGQYIRLFVYIPTSTSSLTLHVTPQSSCDPDLYLSFGSQPINQVTSLTHQFRSNHWGNLSETITVDSTNPYFCSDCIASVAIYGYAGGSFSLDLRGNISTISSSLRNEKSQNSMPSWVTFLIVLLGALSLPIIVYANYARIEHTLSSWFNRRKVNDFNQKTDGSKYVAPNPELTKDEIIRYLSLSEEEQSSPSPLFESTSEEKMLLW